MVVQVDLGVLCLQVFQEGQGHPVQRDNPTVSCVPGKKQCQWVAHVPLVLAFQASRELQVVHAGPTLWQETSAILMMTSLLSWIHDVICRSIIIPLIRSKQVYYSCVPVCRLDQRVPPLQPKWKEKTIIQLFNFITSTSNYRWEKLHGHLCLCLHVEWFCMHMHATAVGFKLVHGYFRSSNIY